jgi:NAD(P)-dependent dehydrogenase (short-subunit alcohol dehydrogenase family)
MNILVTGGLGRVGRPLVQRLLRQGHTVKVIDRIPEAEADLTGLVGASYTCSDVNDFAALRQQVRGMQAIVHLAAIPHPAMGPGHEIFRINCSGSFNVYEAAAQEGIRRVVSASSINALGFNYGIKSFLIRYLPVDEEHPSFTTDPYSFSKQVLEETAAYYWRRDGISGVQLRLPAVMHMTEEIRAMIQKFAPITRQAYESVLAMPADAQQQRAQRLIAEIDTARAERRQEKPWSGEMPEGDWKPDFNDPLPMISFGYTDFWTVIHEEDAAQALEKGVTADYTGSHPLFVADSVNMLNLEAETLARIFYPDAARKRPLVGSEPLVSFDKARSLIGYEPEAAIG